MNTAVKGLVINPDDTLWDAFCGMLNSGAKACESISSNPLTQEELKAQVKLGGTMPDILTRIYHDRGIYLPRQNVDGVYQSYVAELMSRGYRQFTLFENIAETLRLLHEDGWTIVALGDKDEKLIRRAFNYHGIASYFAAILGTSQGLPNKPDPRAFERIETALREQGIFDVTPSDFVMLGNTVYDSRFARADFHSVGYPAGSRMRFLYCTWGIDNIDQECWDAADGIGVNITTLPDVLNYMG